MRIRSVSHAQLIGIPRKGDPKKCLLLPNKVLRKLKYPDYQRTLGNNAICIVCNYKFMLKTRGWADNVKAICHPFRDVSMLPGNKQLELFSESDFVDELWINTEKGGYNHKYDFVIFTIDTTQGIICKGHYSIPMIAKAASDLGMRGLVLDYYLLNAPKSNVNNEPSGSFGHNLRKTRKRLRRCDNIEMVRGLQSQKTLCKMMKSSRCVIFPNTADASPRMIPEALIRGVPIMVNKNIYGGWKYVNETNGVFYDGPESLKQMDKKRDYYLDQIAKALKTIKSKQYDPNNIKKNYYSEYGFYRSAKRLAGIINDIEQKNRWKYVFYRGFNHLLKRWQNFEKKDK